MGRVYRIADLFCGAGGSSTGAIRAIRALGGEVELVAVNHWDVAIATHSRNHPGARHYCVNLDAARPEELVPDGQLDLLMASPECTYHSRARGGKPIHDQKRMSAWHIQRWCSTLDVTAILIENVPEFVAWGPLLPSDRPDPERKGLYFQAWLQALWAMGYQAEWRFLNAADFGDATTRTRFFLQARKDGNPIRWPEPSHTPTGDGDMFGGRPRWRSARDVIDWANPGGSLLGRKRPLSLKTRLRIARGLRKFGGVLAPLYIRLLDLPLEDDAGVLAAATADRPEPFILGQQSGSQPRSTDQPIPTVVAAGAISLVDPMLTAYYGGNEGAQSVDAPVPTITTKARFGLCSPMVVPYGPKAEARSIEEPLPTILTKDRLGMAEPTIEPFVMGKQSNPSLRPVTEPLPTILTQGGGCGYLVSPFIVPQFGERDGQAPRVHDISEPLPAVTSHGAGALVEPVVVQTDQSGRWGKSVRSVDEPLPTVTTQKALALAEPVLLQMAQVGRQDDGMARSVQDPLWTITAHKNLAVAFPALEEARGEVDPNRLVMIDGRPYLLDIRFRMLTNRELARAMGFDDEQMRYEFTGNVAEVTRQIGNAVAVRVAEALVLAIFGETPAQQRAEEALA